MPQAPISMRAFGRAEDLDIAFADSDRPALVTALLDHCAGADDPAFWWAQPVGTRTFALLRLLALTDGAQSLSAQLRCARAECGEAFDVDLPVHALNDHDIAPIHIALAGGRSVLMRRPTGDDLRTWHAARYAACADAAAAVIEALCIDGRTTPDDEPALAEAIAARDPLVAFSVSCACPVCGAEGDLPVDLESLALQRLADRQRGLMREVHQLATHYGWTEHEALAVPPERRARYIALIEGMV